MKKLKLLPLIAAIIAMLFTSCSDYSDHVKIIPEKSSVVASVDLAQIAKKASSADFENFELFKMFNEEASNASPEIKALIEELKSNPLATGLDVLDNVYSFTYNDSLGHMYFGVSAGIMSEGKFSEFVEKIASGLEFEHKLEEKDGFKSLTSGNTSITWDSDKLLVLVLNSYEENADLLGKESSNLMKNKSSSVANNENFKLFYDNDSDIAIWQNTFVGIDTLLNQYVNLSLDNIYSHSFLNFENDEILITSESFYNDEVKALIEKHKLNKSKINESILNASPQNSYLAVGFSTNLSGIYNLAKEVVVDFDKMKEKVTIPGLELEDAFNSLSGDFVFNVSDFKITEVSSYEYEYDDNFNMRRVKTYRKQPMPSIVATCYLNDDVVYDYVSKMLPQDSVYINLSYSKVENGDFDVYYGKVDNVLMVSNDEETVKNFADGKQYESILSTEVGSNLKNSWAYLNCNLKFDEYPVETKQFVESEMNENMFSAFLSVQETFENIEMKTVSETKSEFRIKLKKTGENSLSTILTLIDSTYRKMFSSMM